jgi:hypothetical protein
MKQIMSPLVLVLSVIFASSVSADVYWNNNNGSAPGGDRSWGNSANWIGGLPSATNAGNAVVKPWPDLTKTPIVNTLGNTANEIYTEGGSFFTVIEGGSLTSTALVTGQFDNSGEVQIDGGLFQTGNLLLGNGGFDGKLNISAGEVIANLLSINTSGGAFMNLGLDGKFTAPISNLNNVNFWIANNAIIAESGAAGFSINVDTLSSPDNLVLTVLPEPGTVGLLGVAAILLGGLYVRGPRRKRNSGC